jgi:hypothetical protein
VTRRAATRSACASASAWPQRCCATHGCWCSTNPPTASTRAKTLTAIGYNLLVLAVFAASTIAAGLLIIGAQPLTGLSGQTIAPAHALWLIIAAWATAIAPTIGFTALPRTGP